MVKVFIPQYIDIEDRIMGLITIRQLFSLLGAFLISYIGFKINALIGIIIFVFSFGIAILFTFVRLNGQPFYKIFPSVSRFFLENKTFQWKMKTSIEYIKIKIPSIPKLKKSQIEPVKIHERTIPAKEEAIQSVDQELVIPVEIKHTIAEPPISEKIEIKLTQPLKSQFQELEPPIHRHKPNPENPYRIFPYIQFYKIGKHE